MNWYLKCLKQYADFQGCARRKEYWMCILSNVIIAFVFGYIDGASGWSNSVLSLGILGCLYTLGVFILGLAVSVRRLHDIGEGGLNFRLVLILIMGGVLLFVWFVTEGEYCNIYW